MTYAALKAALRDAGVENFDGEARILLEEFASASAADLLSGKDFADPRLADALARRRAREPLQYILGKWTFYEEEYRVSPACLIPRADTELLVETLIRRLPRGARFLDLCTGSGCIAISTAKHRPDTTALAADLSDAALALADENAAQNGVSTVAFCKIDVTALSPLAERFDCIVSNPPYIRTDSLRALAPELSFEPRTALDGGDDGLLFYRAILENFAANRKDGGFFLFEFGFDQKDGAAALAERHGLSFTPLCDLGGNFRAAIMA